MYPSNRSRPRYPPPVTSTTVDILIANSGSSDAIKVPYKLDEPISGLIKNIQAKLGIDSSSISNQALFINGRRLKDHTQTLAHYRIMGRVLTYRTLPAQTPENKCNISIIIVIPNGNAMPLTCHAETIVEDVKQLIQARLGIPSDLQRLKYEGFQPEDTRLLKYYGIAHGSTLHLTLSQPNDATTLPETVFLVDLGDTLGVRKAQLSTCAIQGRAASPGANVECKCKCTPAHRVICQKALGTLEIPKASFVCPNCNSSDNIFPVAVGFWKCKYRFHGIDAFRGSQITSEWKEVKGEDCYHLVGANIDTNAWSRLVIETVSLIHGDTCTICVQPSQMLNLLKCGHRFHIGCMMKWKSCCPNCLLNPHLVTVTGVHSKK
ncbi:hypothetical protein BGZ96_004537 [Linnemannia gamsii]|uniref:Uncharacterized protein n=1 Tax=Linnemannia gamsii TaxID=64522 RepID=A0ABQ7JI51_9FUNG|nr:hypothetical protein BGZ96_004537 [Linnemannia gamsii]